MAELSPRRFIAVRDRPSELLSLPPERADRIMTWVAFGCVVLTVAGVWLGWF